jgi:hypothetical protein
MSAPSWKERRGLSRLSPWHCIGNRIPTRFAYVKRCLQCDDNIGPRLRAEIRRLGVTAHTPAAIHLRLGDVLNSSPSLRISGEALKA